MTTLRLANGMANPSVCWSVVCDVRARGLTFRGYFCTIFIVALPSGNSPIKSRRSSKEIAPAERVKIKSRLVISFPDKFLVVISFAVTQQDTWRDHTDKARGAPACSCDCDDERDIYSEL